MHAPIRLVSEGGRAIDLEPGAPLSSVAPRGAVAAILDGRAVDLAARPEADGEVRFLTPGDEDGLHVFRHSSAHLLAAAVKELFPDAQYGIGPPIDGGFYYDFRVDEHSRRRTSRRSRSACASW